MRIKLRLSIRMLLLILTASTFIFYTTAKILSRHFKNMAFVEAKNNNNEQAKKYAAIIQATLEQDFDIIRSTAQIMEQNNVLNYESQRPFFDELLKEIARENKDYTAVWDSWELRFTDAEWDLPYGRVSRSFHRTTDELDSVVDSLDMQGDQTESLYYKYKVLPQEAITNPYWYSYTKRKSDQVLETSLIVPLTVNNEFAGLVGIDLKLKTLQQLIDTVNQKNKYQITLFSHGGNIVAHPEPSMLGEKITQMDSVFSSKYKLLDHIQSGEPTQFTITNQQGADSIYFALSPLAIGKTSTSWAILVGTPVENINSQITEFSDIISNVAIIGLIVLIVVILLFAHSLRTPIVRTTQILKQLAKGQVHGIEKLKVKTKDELGEMAKSVNTVVDGLNSVTLFAEEIGQGNYNYNFKQLSDKDILGNAVLEMRNSLQQAQTEEEQRKEQERQLNWASQGINLFNKILRVDNQNLEKLTYDIIKNLTLYLDAHMGGIYLKNDDDEDLYELISFIGFSKAKYEKRNVTPGEGLVGQCILEKESVFVNDVPENTPKVGSGLGASKPVSILVVPLKSNQVMVGILEIESLNNIQPYQVKFVEKIAETVASTLATVKTNERTAQLLDKSQKQAEELEQQEEEMRQNMEEMQATQEEAGKRENELSALIEGFNQLLLITEYNLKGRITDINENYLKILKARHSQVIGKQHKADLFMDENEQVKHREFWDNLKEGKVQESVEYIKSGKDDFWILEKFIPIKDKFGVIKRIVCVGINITEEKKAESHFKQLQEDGQKEKPGTKKPTKKQPAINLKQELNFIDLTYLKMVYKKDPVKIYNILKLYFDTLPAQVNELKEISDQRDFSKLRSKINSLKTKMSYLGLKQIYEQLRNIEKLLTEQKNLANIPDILSQIIKIWESALDELALLLNIKNNNSKTK